MTANQALKLVQRHIDMPFSQIKGSTDEKVYRLQKLRELKAKLEEVVAAQRSERMHRSMQRDMFELSKLLGFPKAIEDIRKDF